MSKNRELFVSLFQIFEREGSIHTTSVDTDGKLCAFIITGFSKSDTATIALVENSDVCRLTVTTRYDTVESIYIDDDTTVEYLYDRISLIALEWYERSRTSDKYIPREWHSHWLNRGYVKEVSVTCYEIC